MKTVPPGRAGRRAAASSVAPVGQAYERSLRPCIALAHHAQSTSVILVRTLSRQKGWNPIPPRASMWGMLLRLALAIAVLVLAGASGIARADTPVLTGNVGANDSFAISLAGPDGARVRDIDPGTYTLVVHDHSELHNFHLR